MDQTALPLHGWSGSPLLSKLAPAAFGGEGSSGVATGALPPAETAWQLEDYVWDPVAMVRTSRARRTPRAASDATPQLGTTGGGAGQAAHAAPTAAQTSLAPSLAPHTVALPAAGDADAAPAAPPQSVKAAPPRPAAAAEPPPSRKRAGRVYSRRPPVCHVPSCGAPLADGPETTSRYCFRFRICPLHLRAQEVLLPDGASRHCQKCCSWHPLAAFDGSNRTCARRLAEQKARRRRGGDGVARVGSSAPEAPSAVDEALRFSFVEALLGDNGVTSALAAPTPVPPAAAAPGARVSAAAALPVVREAALKLGGATPGQLPATLAPALHAAWCDDLALSLEATPRPGCTVLHLDGLLPHDAPPAPDAAALARALRAGPLRAWLAGRTMGVRCGGDAEPPLTSQPPPRLPPLRPAALLCTAPGELRAQRPTQPLPADAALCGRLHGQIITLPMCRAERDDSLRIALPAAGAEGAARFWLAADGQIGGASRAVLLTSDAAIASEVSAALDGAEEGGNAEDEDERERLICALGAALRPGCPARVVAAAADAALRRGWAATSARLLPAVRSALPGADADGLAAARTLLHAAALSGDAALVRLTLRHGGEGAAFGAPEGADEAGITPLHLAAAGRDGGAALALATASPSALLAWFHARSLDGATPADVARAAGGVAAEAHATLRRRLEAARDIVVALAAGDDVDAAAAGGDAQLVEVARLMLRVYAPAGGAPSAPQRALFYQHRMASQRILALITPPFVVAINLRALSLPPLDAADLTAVALPALPSFAQMLTVYKAMQRPFVALTVLVNVLLLALAGLPALRGAFMRHGRAALRAYCIFQFIARRTLAELQLRRTLRGGAVLWPSPAGAALMGLSTLHMAAMPLPAPDVRALMALQWLYAGLGHATDWPIWPRSAGLRRDLLMRTALMLVLAAAATAAEARALAAWCAARRARIKKTHAKQA